MNLGTVPTETGFSYDRHQNPLLQQNILSMTSFFGHNYPAFDIDNEEYATAVAAAVFARALGGSVVEIPDVRVDMKVIATKYGIVLGDLTVVAGGIASVLGDDPGYGRGDAKDGQLADKVWHVPYSEAIFKGLAGRLMAAVKAAGLAS